MNDIRKIELLSPAKNLECGMEAINHGADAVYIGASRYGARAAAGNSLEDINVLTDYAHVYGAKVYITLNTILKDEELVDTENLIHDLYNIGVDALIIQDMGILKMNLPEESKIWIFQSKRNFTAEDAQTLKWFASKCLYAR